MFCPECIGWLEVGKYSSLGFLSLIGRTAPSRRRAEPKSGSRASSSTCSDFASAGGAAAGLGCTEAAGVGLIGASSGEGTVPLLRLVGVAGYFRRAAPALALLATLDAEEPIVRYKESTEYDDAVKEAAAVLHRQ